MARETVAYFEVGAINLGVFVFRAPGGSDLALIVWQTDMNRTRVPGGEKRKKLYKLRVCSLHGEG